VLVRFGENMWALTGHFNTKTFIIHSTIDCKDDYTMMMADIKSFFTELEALENNPASNSLKNNVQDYFLSLEGKVTVKNVFSKKLNSFRKKLSSISSRNNTEEDKELIYITEYHDCLSAAPTATSSATPINASPPPPPLSEKISTAAQLVLALRSADNQGSLQNAPCSTLPGTINSM